MASPTYHNLGDHTESFQVDYDPDVIGYATLVKLVLESGNHRSPPSSEQYKSILFYHDAEQLRVARQLLDKSLYIEVRKAGPFTLAEDYHQKYYLRQSSLGARFEALFPDSRDFVDSTAVTRANGYVSGYGEGPQLARELPQLGLGAEQQAELKKAAGERGIRCGE